MFTLQVQPPKEEYPANPNGSLQDIAGIINPSGNVLGLMPHPEDHIYDYQHPNWTRGESGGMGVKLLRRINDGIILRFSFLDHTKIMRFMYPKLTEQNDKPTN